MQLTHKCVRCARIRYEKSMYPAVSFRYTGWRCMAKPTCKRFRKELSVEDRPAGNDWS